MFVQRLRDWLSLRDYDEARDKATKKIVARYSRGNIKVQLGSFLDRKNLDNRSLAADHSMANIQKMMKNH